MLKRTLIAVTVVALLATSAQAFGPDPHTGRSDKTTGIKVDPLKMNVLWPFVEYKALDLCVIPVKMEIGIFIQIFECHKLKIIMKQVNCEDIGKGTNDGGNWPCYKGCTGESDTKVIKVRSNFDMKLGLKKARIGSVLHKDRWKAEFAGDDFVNAADGWKELQVCVTSWRTELWNSDVNASAGSQVDVGTVTLTVKPNV